MNTTCRQLAGVALVSLTVVSAAVASGTPVHAVTPPGGATSPVLLIDDQSYAVERGEVFEAALSIQAPPATIAALSGNAAEIRVTVHEAITDVAQLDQAGSAAMPAVDVAVLAAAPVLEASGESAVGTLALPVAERDGGRDSIDLPAPGIYPITIDVVAGSVVAAGSTYLELTDPESPSPPLSVAILAAAEDAGAYRRLADVAGRTDAPLSVALLPSVAAETVADQGEGLRFDELLALPHAPLDPSAVVAAGEAAAFTRMLRDGEDVLSAANPLAVVSRAVWIADRPISGAGAAMLRDLGVRMLVLPDAVAASLGADPARALFEVDLGDGNSLPAMTIDPRGSQLASPTSGDATPTERAVRLVVELRLSRRAGALPVAVLGAPGLAAPDGDVTAQFADLFDDLPDVTIVPLSRLPGIAQGLLRADGPSVPLPATAGPDLSGRRAEIVAARGAASHAASMIVTSPRRDGWMRRLDALLASDIDDATAAQRLAELDDEIDGVLTAIVAPEPFTFTLTGTTNTLRLPLRNTATEPLRVRLAVRSAKLVVDDPIQMVEVPALSSVDVDVPVRARSQGTFTIEVDVLAPDGNRLGAPVVLKGRVNHARGLSQLATGGAALVLASWWFMHLRRRRTRQLLEV